MLKENPLADPAPANARATGTRARFAAAQGRWADAAALFALPVIPVHAVLTAEPFIKAVDKLRKKNPKAKVLITSAGGKTLTNAYAKALTKHKDVIILCGRYEGIDERFIDNFHEHFCYFFCCFWLQNLNRLWNFDLGRNTCSIFYFGNNMRTD